MVVHRGNREACSPVDQADSLVLRSICRGLQEVQEFLNQTSLEKGEMVKDLQKDCQAKEVGSRSCVQGWVSRA